VLHPADQRRENSFLRVQAVFGFLEDQGARAFHDGVADLQTAVGREAVQDHGAGIFLSQFKRGYRPTCGEAERPLIDRLTLHAQRLSVKNVDGTKLSLEAEPPKDLRATLNQLRRYSAKMTRCGSTSADARLRSYVTTISIFRGMQPLLTCRVQRPSPAERRLVCRVDLFDQRAPQRPS
jgi:hypothetical protein